MLKYIITKIINQAIILSFYVGILLAFLFWDKTYLWICVPQVFYFFGTLYDIPVLSYFVRMFNWPLIKISVINNLKNDESKSDLFFLIMYLKHSNVPKKIYIKEGNSKFVEHINNFIEDNNRRTPVLFQQLSNVSKELKELTEKGLSKEECEEQVSAKFQNIVPEGNPELNKKLSSLFVELEQHKAELKQKESEGMPKDELQKLALEKMIGVFKKIKNQENGEKSE